MSEEQQQPASSNHQPSTALAPAPAELGVPQNETALVSPFSNNAAFSAAQRMAKALAASSIVPAAYRGDAGLPNCLIAMELASRIGVSVLAAMQNLDIIQGKPSWSAKFLIATVNASGRFTPIRFEWGGEPGKDSWACRARAKDKSDGEACVGPWVTWSMANKEGWAKKSGSKWQTMPELMFCYRAAAFWSRLYCPEISVGFQTSEELRDTHGYDATAASAELPAQLSPGSAKSLEAVLGVQRAAADVVDMPEDDAPQTPEQMAATAVAGQIEMADTSPKKGK